MKNFIFILSIAWNCVAFAGGVEGGGPKGKTGENPIQVEIPDLGQSFDLTVVDPLTGKLVPNPKITEGQVSHEELIRAIEATLAGEKAVTLDLGKAGVVNFTPDKLDLPAKKLEGILETGAKLKLKQIQEIEVRN